MDYNMKGKAILICYIFLVLICTISMFMTADYQFIQVDTAMDFTIKYFALPIIILTIPSSYIIYYYFQNKSKTNHYYQQKNKHDAKSIFRVSFMSITISGVLIVGTSSIVLLSNEFLSQNETVCLDSKIIDSFSIKSKGSKRFYISVQDKNSNKILKFKVKNQNFQIGQELKVNLKVGKWGIIYLK